MAEYRIEARRAEAVSRPGTLPLAYLERVNASVERLIDIHG